jgi:flagellar protein FliO/FliZ
MDAYSLMRTLGALAVVLGLLAGALWIVRRYDIGLPGRIGSGGGGRRIEVVERTTLDGRRSVALLRRDGREHLILLAPEGNIMLEAGIIRDEIDHAAETARLESQREAIETSKAEAEAFRESFAAMVENTRSSVKGSFKAAAPILQQVRSRLPGPVAASPLSSPEADIDIDADADAEASAKPASAATKESDAGTEPKAARTRKGRRPSADRARSTGRGRA